MNNKKLDEAVDEYKKNIDDYFGYCINAAFRSGAKYTDFENVIMIEKLSLAIKSMSAQAEGALDIKHIDWDSYKLHFTYMKSTATVALSELEKHKTQMSINDEK